MFLRDLVKITLNELESAHWTVKDGIKKTLIHGGDPYSVVEYYYELFNYEEFRLIQKHYLQSKYFFIHWK